MRIFSHLGRSYWLRRLLEALYLRLAKKAPAPSPHTSNASVPGSGNAARVPVMS